jgi:predicted alpha/beta hydrolase family esterase
VGLSGKGDPYVPSQQGEELAASLSVKSHIIPSGGHLNAKFDYTSFPLLFALLNQAAV